MNSKRLIRPNPNWEEDLANSVVVGPSDVNRVYSYRKSGLKQKRKKCCKCKVLIFEMHYVLDNEKYKN